VTDDRAARWGIDSGYLDMHRVWRRAPDHTIAALGRAMGMTSQDPPRSPVISARPGEALGIDGTVEIHTEDGGVVRVADRLPPDLPLGYHDLIHPGSDSVMRLVIAPRRCFLPTDLFGWGWAIQLYALRSRSSWGIGDLGDLRRLNEWAARMGAGAVLINPLHSVDPEPHRASPYFPSSRLFRNPLYLRVEEIQGAAEASLDLEKLASAGRSLNGDRRIDRAAVHRLKSDALELLWRRFGGDRAFDRYRAEVGTPLRDYATFLALTEQFGSDWHRWAPQLRHPRSPAVVRAAHDLGHRVLFHEWVQWCLDRQFESASADLPVTNDLAIGVDPGGADAWLWQDFFASGVTIGAPPDDFNLSGQDWGVLPLHPWRLRSGCYEPFIHTVRASLRHAEGLRYDHVMGLFRLFWIPLDGGPADGTYVRYPSADLLDILALESHRAGAYVVGEDLGTVEAGVRERLARRNVLSYRLMFFELSPPIRYPVLAVAGVGNHDLPTLPGLWSGSDLADQASAGVTPNRGFATGARERLAAVAGVDRSAPTDEAVAAVYRTLAEAPSMMVTATLDDALGVEERPNIPGSGSERANWSLALPHLLEEIERHPGPRALGRLLARRP
jgi:4-alpha-glucanotransferase